MYWWLILHCREFCWKVIQVFLINHYHVINSENVTGDIAVLLRIVTRLQKKDIILLYHIRHCTSDAVPVPKSSPFVGILYTKHDNEYISSSVRISCNGRFKTLLNSLVRYLYYAYLCTCVSSEGVISHCWFVFVRFIEYAHVPC